MTDLIKQDGVFVCQSCGMKYSVEEAKKMMIEGTVDVKGTVKVDNSAFVEKYLQNAHRALSKEDWEEVEKYYNMVEQNVPNNMEAVFFSSYGKAMLAMTDDDYFKRQQKFEVLNRSMSVISDYYEDTTENKQQVLTMISDYIVRMYNSQFVFQRQDVSVVGAIRSVSAVTGSKQWCVNLLNTTKAAFVTELKQISEKHDDAYIQELIKKFTTPEQAQSKSGGCYVATAVYGSYDCPQVWTLRRYRDYTLAETWYGRAFIYTYYAISPTLVKWFGTQSGLRKCGKANLTAWLKNYSLKVLRIPPMKTEIGESK